MILNSVETCKYLGLSVKGRMHQRELTLIKETEFVLLELLHNYSQLPRHLFNPLIKINPRWSIRP